MALNQTTESAANFAPIGFSSKSSTRFLGIASPIGVLLSRPSANRFGQFRQASAPGQ
jgi:hypothetical protein